MNNEKGAGGAAEKRERALASSRKGQMSRAFESER